MNFADVCSDLEFSISLPLVRQWEIQLIRAQFGHKRKWLPYLVDRKTRYLVRRGALEPSRCYPLAPQTSAHAKAQPRRQRLCVLIQPDSRFADFNVREGKDDGKAGALP
jgi:hypothetical protein